MNDSNTFMYLHNPQHLHGNNNPQYHQKNYTLPASTEIIVNI